MPKAEPEGLKKVTLNLYERDYNRIADLYPRTGAAKAIREILRQHIQKIDRLTPNLLGLEDELNV